MEENKPSCPLNCGCVGYGYVPYQTLTTLYENLDDALSQGTIFPELDLNICEYGYVCKKMGGVL